ESPRFGPRAVVSARAREENVRYPRPTLTPPTPLGASGSRTALRDPRDDRDGRSEPPPPGARVVPERDGPLANPDLRLRDGGDGRGIRAHPRFGAARAVAFSAGVLRARSVPRRFRGALPVRAHRRNGIPRAPRRPRARAVPAAERRRGDRASPARARRARREARARGRRAACLAQNPKCRTAPRSGGPRQALRRHWPARRDP